MGKIIERVRKRQRAAHEKHRREFPYYDCREDEWVTLYEAVKRGMLLKDEYMSRLVPKFPASTARG